jgi:hypothetical protein
MNDIEKSKLEKIATKINDHNYQLMQSARKTVEEAASIGILMIEAKEILPHGEFLPWIERKTKISIRTAQSYMSLTEIKYANFAYLEEAYKAVEDKRAQEKRKEHERKMRLFAERKKTGKEPAGWTPALEKEYKAHYDDEERAARVKKFVDEKEKTSKANIQKKANDDARKKVEDEAFRSAVQETISYMKKLENTKQSMSGNEDLLFMIDGYLEKLENNSRRHEFCNTLIKHLKNKSIEYGRGK